MLPGPITFLIVLSLVVLIHELGHFIAAKWIGVKVEEFGFGYPPRAIGKKVGETIYSINWLPFGGFVRLFGEQEADLPAGRQVLNTKSDRAFFNKKKRERSLVILAGVFMNLVLGVFCFSLLYSFQGIPETVDYVVIQAVAPNSPAEASGLMQGDKVISVNGVTQTDFTQFSDYIRSQDGNSVDLTISRNEEIQTLTLTPEKIEDSEVPVIGVIVANVDTVFYPWWQMPFRGAWTGVQETYAWTVTMMQGLGSMVMTAFQGSVPQVTGPVGIYQITTEVAKQGLDDLIRFVGILSINLAVVNILPIPALDGGRFVFILLEGIIGKRIKPQIEAYVNLAGMAVLIGLMLLITYSDIMRLISS